MPIDRQKIIDTILHGSATLADGMIAPIVACYTPTPTYDYDLEKAKQLHGRVLLPQRRDLIMVIQPVPAASRDLSGRPADAQGTQHQRRDPHL